MKYEWGRETSGKAGVSCSNFPQRLGTLGKKQQYVFLPPFRTYRRQTELASKGAPFKILAENGLKKLFLSLLFLNLNQIEVSLVKPRFCRITFSYKWCTGSSYIGMKAGIY